MKALRLFFSKPLMDLISDLVKARVVIIEIPVTNRLNGALMVTSKRDAIGMHSKGMSKIHLRIALRRTDVVN
jgi:hypothetical protein